MNSAKDDFFEEFAFSPNKSTPLKKGSEKIPEEKDFFDEFALKPSKEFSVSEKNREEFKNMSVPEMMAYAQDVNRQRDYQRSKGFTKGLLSGASAGATENIESLKPKEGETGGGFGEFIGATVPIGLTAKAIGYPLKFLGNLSKSMNFAKNVGISAGTGAAYSAEKSLAKGEAPDPLHMAAEGGAFGALHLAGAAIMKGVPAVANWVKGLKPQQRTELLYDGVVPKNLSENDYKFFEEKVLPEIQRVGREDYESALAKSVEANERSYQNELANVKAKHEAEMFEIAQKQNASEAEFQAAEQAHQDEVKKITDEYNFNKSEIEKSNQEAQKEFQVQQEQFDLAKARQKAVKNEIGSVISPDKISNTSKGGELLKSAIQASDDIDYRNVNRLYDKARELNANIASEQTSLSHSLMNKLEEMDKIPSLSTPEQQIKSSIQKILGELVETSEGNIIGYKPINNQVLLDQAKSLRYNMDYDFAHGNAKGIYKPVINLLEEAAEMTAASAGNEEAYQAHQAAKNAYREWAETYNNDYIRPFRDRSNKDFSKLYKGALDIDEYRMIDQVLSKSNAGQNLSTKVKRSLIEKHLKKYIGNPHRYESSEFSEALSELEPIITPEEAKDFRKIYSEGRRFANLYIKAPKEPKLAKEPKAPKIPEFTTKKREVPEITRVNLPKKKEVPVTKQMHVAGKIMHMTPEEAMKMTDTPSGLKEMKKILSKTDAQKKLFQNIGERKIREIFHEGNIRKNFTGNELAKVINKGDNYFVLSEILGEEVAQDLLTSAEEIAGAKVTVDAIKKHAKRIAAVKAIHLFGIL